MKREGEGEGGDDRCYVMLALYFLMTEIETGISI